MEEGGEFLNGVIREYGKSIAYVHFRNVVGKSHGIPEISDPEGSHLDVSKDSSKNGLGAGKAPNYNEVFIDEGDVDMVEAMRAYAEAGFDGVMQPDHTPLVTVPPGCEGASWHVGMAFAVGYMKAAAKAAGVPFDTAPAPAAL